jgi:hypothetical protein
MWFWTCCQGEGGCCAWGAESRRSRKRATCCRTMIGQNVGGTNKVMSSTWLPELTIREVPGGGLDNDWSIIPLMCGWQLLVSWLWLQGKMTCLNLLILILTDVLVESFPKTLAVDVGAADLLLLTWGKKVVVDLNVFVFERHVLESQELKLRIENATCAYLVATSSVVAIGALYLCGCYKLFKSGCAQSPP